MLASIVATTRKKDQSGLVATGTTMKSTKWDRIERIRPRPPLSKVQVHPTGLVNPADPNYLSKMLAPEAMRGSGGVLLTGSGKRFCDELDTRAKVTAAINASCGPAAGSESNVAMLVSTLVRLVLFHFRFCFRVQ